MVTMIINIAVMIIYFQFILNKLCTTKTDSFNGVYGCKAIVCDIHSSYIIMQVIVTIEIL